MIQFTTRLRRGHTFLISAMNLVIISLSLFVVACYGEINYSDRPRNFSIELVHYTALETAGHVVISPFGVWTLMTGVALGATGKTYDELRYAFILPKNDKALITGYKKLTQVVLNPSTKEVSLSSQNFMFLDKGFHINDEFKTVMQSDFGASIKTLDFNDPNTAAKVANGYIQNTGGRVSNVLTSDDFAESRMILTNVISFKGLWGLPFNKSDTIVEPFYNENREKIGEVNMMYQRAEVPFSNMKALRARVVELPYGHDGKYSMLIILPVAGATVYDVYKNFANITLIDVFNKLQSDVKEYGLEGIDVRIPRFKISTNVVLNKPLNNMGVYKIFDPIKATFGRVTKESIFVSAIVHKADIEVTESGTVASATSTADFADRISSPSFLVNKPFIYFIMEKTTMTMLFGGIYSKPTIY